MDTTLRFYNYPSLFDRAILAEERACWQHEQHCKVGGYDTFNCSLLRDRIASSLNLACHNFHTDEMLDEVEKACYEYHPELKNLNYREPTPFDNLFEDNPKLEFVPHKSLHEELNAGPIMDDDDLPF